MATRQQAREELARDPDRGIALLRSMMLIRRFEERAEEQYTRARIGGYCHLAIGEEAANVGAIDALEDGDYVFASYRDHGTALAVGSPPVGVMAELFGKATGVAGGYGGSMHLLDVERRFLGGWGIVGGHLPIATGAALALAYTGAQAAVLCQLGEGATATGAFHESLNLAALWRLPIVFQVINNHYGMGTRVEQSSAEPEVWRRAAAYRIAGERVDGNDIVAVREAAGRLLERARAEREPALLETLTYRHRGHSVADAGKVYRTADEVAEWRGRDPIERFVEVLRREGVLDDERLGGLRREIDAEVADAIREAAAAPAPDPAGIYDNVYGDAGSAEQFRRMTLAGPFGEREGTRAWRT